MNSLTDQIVNGLSEGQLAEYGGALTLDPDTGTMELGGDPGMGGPVFEAASDIIGQTRLVPLFSTVHGNGNNTKYVIVGFAGARILDASKSGANKFIRLQPANIKDDSFVMGDSGFESWGAISDPQLTK